MTTQPDNPKHACRHHRPCTHNSLEIGSFGQIATDDGLVRVSGEPCAARIADRQHPVLSSPKRFSALLFVLVVYSVFALSGCQQSTKKVLTYVSQKSAVSQGNLMFREDMARLRLGMSKEEIQFILGAPLVKGTFEENRWYYLFYLNLKPFPQNDPDHIEYVFTGIEGAEEWEKYWRVGEIAQQYLRGGEKKDKPEQAAPDEEKSGDEQGGSELAEAEDGATEDELAEELERESERITTVHRGRFVESDQAHPTGVKIVFYGRMTLDFEANSLKSISLLETPELSPGNTR